MYSDLSGKQLEDYLQFLRDNYDPIAEAKQERLWWLDRLEEEYRLNVKIRKDTMRAVTRYAKEMRAAATPEDAQVWIGYIRTCKELVNALDEANISIRKEMREIAHGTKDRR